jgi:hypothetical protein
VGKDEVCVKVDGLLVVGRSKAELGKDKVELGAVVVDVWVLRVVGRGVLEVFGGCVAVAC